MVSVTTILKLGPLGRTGWRGWARGGPGLRDRVRGGVWSGVQKCLHSWESPKGFYLGWHTSSRVPVPGSGLRMADCARDGPTRAQGKVVVLGASQDSCQCLQPTRGSLELGGGDEFVKHNRSLSGTKEGGAGAPRSVVGPHSRSRAGTGQRRVASPPR